MSWPRAAHKRRLILLLFFLSGASGLLYEVTWMRRLTHVFGSTTLAISSVLAAFMGGLALGSYLFGRYADRRPAKALPAYGVLEIAIGILALVIPLLFRAAASLYLRLYPSLEAAPHVFFFLQFVLVALVIVIPTSFMGGTLPLVSKAVVAGGEEIRGSVGRLYAANTVGAAAGVALSTYLLLPKFGVARTELAAASINLLVGVAALLLARSLRAGLSEPETSIPEEPSRAADRILPLRTKVLLLGVLLSGFAAMVYEVAWSRVLAMIIGSSVYSFGMMLLLFLASLSLGSLLFARLRIKPGSHVTVFVLIQAGLTGTGLLGFGLIPHLPSLVIRFDPFVANSFWLKQTLHLFVTGLLLAPSGILFGMAFPAVVAATTDRAASVGRGVGRVAALNTIGTVAGAFLGGFVLIPRLGLLATFLLGAAATGVAMLACTLVNPAATRQTRRLYASFAIALLLFGAALAPGWNREVLAMGPGYHAARFGSAESFRSTTEQMQLLYYKDGINTTISVDQVGDVRLYRSNGKTDASTHPGDMATQRLLGYIPMLHHPHPVDVFVLGLGTGTTAGVLARYPIRSMDIVDIEPAARDAAGFFEAENRRVLADRRVRLISADGRNALLARPRSYDIIVSDPSDVWVAGVGNLFTREFYEQARHRLRRGGIMVQWFHTHALSPENLKLIVATFRSVFPQTAYWRPNSGDVILAGSVEVVPWDYQRLLERYEKLPGVRQDFQRTGFRHPLALFSAFVLEGQSLERMLGGTGRRHTDDHPVIEFLTPRDLSAETVRVSDEGAQRFQGPLFPKMTGFDPARQLDAPTLYLLGLGHAALGRTDSAIFLMEESLRREPSVAAHWVGLGRLYKDRKRPLRAAEAFRQALALEPGQAEAALELSDLLRAESANEEASRVLKSALEAVPGDARLSGDLGDLLLDLKRPAEAAPLLAAAVEKQPGDASLALRYGLALSRLGRPEEALFQLRRAIRLSPEDARVQRALGWSLADSGELAEAKLLFEHALRHNARDSEALAGIAEVARRSGDLVAAREARARAAAIDPYNPRILALPAK